MKSIEILRLESEKMDTIRPLWERLKAFHEENSIHFKERFQEMSWEKRKDNLLAKSSKILFEYAVDRTNDKAIGYCISTINKHDHKTGEIDSLYVEKKYRNHGIGKQFMENAIHWLIEQETEVQKLAVGAGNEQVINFYKQFDFFPLHIILQKKHT